MESMDTHEKSNFDTDIQATQSSVPMPVPGSPSLLSGATGASSTLDKYTKSGGDSQPIPGVNMGEDTISAQKDDYDGNLNLSPSDLTTSPRSPADRLIEVYMSRPKTVQEGDSYRNKLGHGSDDQNHGERLPPGPASRDSREASASQQIKPNRNTKTVCDKVTNDK